MGPMGPAGWGQRMPYGQFDSYPPPWAFGGPAVEADADAQAVTMADAVEGSGRDPDPKPVPGRGRIEKEQAAGILPAACYGWTFGGHAMRPIQSVQ